MERRLDEERGVCCASCDGVRKEVGKHHVEFVGKWGDANDRTECMTLFNNQARCNEHEHACGYTMNRTVSFASTSSLV